MKSFLKYLLATVTGIILTSMMFFLLLLVIIGISSAEKPVEIKSNSLLYMKLNDVIVERAVDNPFDFLFSGFPMPAQTGLNDILDNIRKAAEDENIAGIYLELSVLQAGSATTEEIRNALIDFKESGKFILAYGDLMTQRSYYLASVADHLYLNPDGYFVVQGLEVQMLFFKGALEKLGIEAQFIRQGDYKSFGEPFTRENMSDENREQITRFIQSMWKHMVHGIADARGLDPETVDQAAGDFSVRSPEDALRQGFVDGLMYKDEVIAKLKELTGTAEEKDLKSVSLKQYTKVPAKRSYKGFTKDKVAVIYAYGDVLLGNTGEGSVASDRISRIIRKARRDSSIKAIVLRINSGGGGSLASDIIWREVDLARAVKPVVASIGDVAASGGYLILAPADTVLAHPNSITGSIGVFAIIPNVQNLLNQKLGITVDAAKTHPYADLGTPLRPLSQEERNIIRDLVRDTYESFTGKVANGRDIAIEELEKIAGGRVYTGEDALEIGLIDGFGGVQDAVELAARMAGLEKYRVTELPELEDPIEVILRELAESRTRRLLKREFGDYYQHFQMIERVDQLEGIQARLPYQLEIR